MTIQTILSNLQNDVTALTTYVASLVPTGGTVPQNIASALSALTAAQSQLNADLAANPVTVGTPVAAVIVTDVANLLAAVNALTTAIQSPSNP